jgi:hypothetical protein
MSASLKIIDAGIPSMDSGSTFGQGEWTPPVNFALPEHAFFCALIQRANRFPDASPGGSSGGRRNGGA